MDGKARSAAPVMRDQNLVYKSVVRTKGQRKVVTRTDKGMTTTQKVVAIRIFQHHNIKGCSCIVLTLETSIIATTRNVPYEIAEARAIPRI